MSSCCHAEDKSKKPLIKRIDYILWGSLAMIAPAYFLHIAGVELKFLHHFCDSVYELINKMWFGVLLGIFFVGLLDKVPREIVTAILGRKKGLGGILRATLAGTVLDLCSHGILLVGMKLYERGASAGQLMAFLIASPWNSISLTIILFTLIGVKWTLLFILFSVIVAIISGLIFEFLVKKQVLPANPNEIDLPEDYNFKAEVKKMFSNFKINSTTMKSVLEGGVKGSKMILKWVFFGVVLASLIRAFVPQDIFANYFGASLLGLLLTLVAATVIEVCSEGSAPIASDIMTRADAAGNSFVFLMAGVSTDYTEIMAIKETTKSWKISLFLPLVTLPQILMIGWLINIQ